MTTVLHSQPHKQHQPHLEQLPDFTYQDEGSIVILYANTAAALEWVDTYLDDGRQCWGTNGTAIEWRYFPAISNGLTDAGFAIDQVR